MKTRLIIFRRTTDPSPDAAGLIAFAHWADTLQQELPESMGVEDFAKKFKLKRHSEFDWSVGDMGRQATLLECCDPGFSQLAFDARTELKLNWSSFRDVAKSLKDGSDRRYLQLAVQYLAAGARLDESVIAADYDAEFIQQLQKTLASKSSDEKPS